MKRMEQTTKSLVLRMRDTTNDSRTLVEPYPQPALDGDLGLTDEDIANSLDANVKFVRQKLRRSEFINNAKSAGFRMSSSEDLNKNGVLVRKYVFDVNASKAFVAKWESESGWGYLSFLLKCEKAVVETIPRMIRELGEAREIIKKLTKPKRKTLPTGESVVTLTQIVVKKDIFGVEYCEPFRVQVPMNQLDQAQYQEYKIRHINKVQSGLTKSAEKALSKTVFMTPSNIKQLRPTDKE